MFSGQTPPPAEGARFDVYFEGPVTGKVKGTVKGVDYLHIRADGRAQLDMRCSHRGKRRIHQPDRRFSEPPAT